MKHPETLLNTLINGNELNGFTDHEIGDDHLSTGLETPLREDAFNLSDTEKKEQISYLFGEIMNVMGLDLNDDSLQGTPKRVAKMYIDEIFSGLNPENKPKIALFENKYQYNQMLIEKNILMMLQLLLMPNIYAYLREVFKMILLLQLLHITGVLLTIPPR